MEKKLLVDGSVALAERQPRVIKIAAAERQNALLRVAAYTRVSSDSADQLHSFAAQNRYYTTLISGKLNGSSWTSMLTRGFPGLRQRNGRASSG